ncbi:Tubby-related protein 4, partial [Orchesella cincta]
ITLVQWNEPYQKLASCDSAGIIFVWIKFEGRWSIELINDRNTPVTHFSWSHDGRMALICYQDCFVLVGSVAGQRYWSTMLNLDATITCGIWTPDDQQVYFGTSNGQIVVMDVHGVMVSQVQLPSDSPISSMAWSCEKFKMEESEDGEATSSSNHYCNKRPFLLAVCFKTGGIYLMKSYDDVAPIYISTGMHGLQMEWSNSGEFLAVAGSRPIEVLHENGNRVKEYSNSLHVYNHQGIRIVNINIPHVLSPVTAMTWGHNDKRIFVATGKLVHVGWVSKRIASLQLLCRLAIYKTISTEACVSHLPLPIPVRTLISSLHTQTIPSPFPDIKDLRDFVVHPPSGNRRLYCTMIRHDDDATQSPGTTYTLYLEFLGGLIPILKGKRTSKIRPEFVIYDPQAIEGKYG